VAPPETRPSATSTTYDAFGVTAGGDAPGHITVDDLAVSVGPPNGELPAARLHRAEIGVCAGSWPATSWWCGLLRPAIASSSLGSALFGGRGSGNVYADRVVSL
jgi:hypothetical protein